MATITLHGNTIHTNGEPPAVGSQAPDFKLVNKDLEDVGLADFRGKRKLISIVPSLDTGVCAKSTEVFSKRFGGRDDVVLIVVSADLPFAQQRFCDTHKLDNVATLSMMRDRHFAKDYGVLIEDGPLRGVTARAVLVLDAHDKVVYAELVPEIAQEPDYDAALSALENG